MNSESLSNDELQRAVKRVGRHSGSLVSGLAAIWKRAFPDQTLTRSLDCTDRTLSELALCLRPRPENWIVDVGEIAAGVGIDPTRLENFFRQAEVLERLALAHPVDGQGGQLLAARDRTEDD